MSRSTDDKGFVRPDREQFIARAGMNALSHYNAQQTSAVGSDGEVINVLA